MNGTKVLVDTNVFINLGSGNKNVDEKLFGKTLYYSIITEIELLGFHAITEFEKSFFTDVLSECIALEISYSIRIAAIDLRRKYKLKTPDAIIAASAIELKIPLLTTDKDFNKIKELNVIII
jgi:predicted nucleic acid-binding protein